MLRYDFLVYILQSFNEELSFLASIWHGIRAEDPAVNPIIFFSFLFSCTMEITNPISSILPQSPQTPLIPPQNPPQTEHPAAQIGIKLNGTNYAIWSQIMEMFISGRDKLRYINGDLSQPTPTDPTFRQWRTKNSIVKGWLINSMEPHLIGNFIRFPTA
jgi:hypothetical protein